MFFQQDFSMTNNNQNIEPIDSCLNNLSNIEFNFNCINSQNEEDYINTHSNNNIIDQLNRHDQVHHNNNSRTQILKAKRDHIKFILSKQKVKNASLNQIDRNTKNELIKQKNREASQKSRNRKKEKFLYLIQENVNLRQEIGNYNDKINLLCNHCKDMFNDNHDEKSINNPLTSNLIMHHCQRDTLQSQSHYHLSSSSSLFSSHSFSNLIQSWQSSFYLCIIFTLCIIFCLLYTHHNTMTLTGIKVIKGNISSQVIHLSKNNQRQLIQAEEKETKYTSIKQMPQILIDDPNSKMSYYVNFEDFYKLKNKNMDICSNPLLENIVNNKNITFAKKQKSFYDSIYFKLFVPLCNESNVSSLNYFLNEHHHNYNNDIIEIENNKKTKNNENNNQNDGDDNDGNNQKDESRTSFYYEVECQVMNFTKMIRKIK